MVYVIFFAVIGFLIATAGIVSGAETAITGSSKAYIYHLAKSGNKKARHIIELKKDMSKTIGTILVLNQLIIYCIPVMSTMFAFKYFTTAQTAAVQALIAFLLLIYAEIFPKMLAIQYSSQYALFVVPFIKAVVFVLRPVVAVLDYCSELTLKLFKKDGTSSEDDHSDEELRGAIEMHSSNGDEIEAEKKTMLKNILDLEDISVSHVMVHRKNMFAIDISLSVEQISEKLMECPYSRVPMWKDNQENIVGILKTRTFFRAIKFNENWDNIKVSSMLTTPWFIPETTHLREQLQNFRKKREHFALVVDEYGDLMGCITLEDILEEIVGDIDDEYDSNDVGVKQQADGSVIADGATPIRDLNRQFDWNIPEDEAATIGGYIMHELRKIPDAGQVYIIANFRIEIIRRQGNHVSLVKITKMSINDSTEVE